MGEILGSEYLENIEINRLQITGSGVLEATVEGWLPTTAMSYWATAVSSVDKNFKFLILIF